MAPAAEPILRFERELGQQMQVKAEGMWMGGNLPPGHDLKSGSLRPSLSPRRPTPVPHAAVYSAEPRHHRVAAANRCRAHSRTRPWSRLDAATAHHPLPHQGAAAKTEKPLIVSPAVLPAATIAASSGFSMPVSVMTTMAANSVRPVRWPALSRCRCAPKRPVRASPAGANRGSARQGP